MISFLKTCGEENLMFLLHPPRLEKALAVLDTDNSGEVDVDECTASGVLLSQRFDPTHLPHRGDGDQPRPREAPGADGEGARAARRAAAAADEEFSAEFLTAARKVFQMIDDDDSGTLEKAEIVTRRRANMRKLCPTTFAHRLRATPVTHSGDSRARTKEVIKFLTDCGNKNLQHLLVPSRLEAALAAMDTDHDGSIDADEWESATLGRLSTSPAHRSMFARGGVHREGAREQARAARRGPRGAEQGGAEGDRRVHGRVPFRPPSAASN